MAAKKDSGRVDPVDMLDQMSEEDWLEEDENGSHLENPASSEAEQAAEDAAAPARSLHAVGSGRQMTEQQRAFAQGLIDGQRPVDSYRAAYPNCKAATQTVVTAAYKLRRHPNVQRMLADASDQSTDNIAGSIEAQRLHVLRELIELSKGAKQEGSRLRALELLGRSAGLYRDQSQAKTVEPITAAALKAQLVQHLRLVNGASRRDADAAPQAEEP